MFNVIGGFNFVVSGIYQIGISVDNVSISADAGDIVTLESFPQFDDSIVIWNQVAGESVNILNSSNAIAHFVAPSNFDYSSVVVFRVVELKDNLATAAYIYVSVNAASEPDKRIKDIIAKARVTLGDTKEDRYKDSDLLVLLSEAQEDFAKQTKILKSVKEVQIQEGQYYVDLPEDCWLLTRASYNSTKLPMMTYADIDHIIHNDNELNYSLDIKSGWEDNTGHLSAIIYDKNNLNRVRLYPIPEVTESSEISSDFGVLSTVDQLVNDGSVSSQYGVVSSSNLLDGVLRVYYVRTTNEVKQMTDVLDIPKMFDIALKYYIVGHSFLNDNDSGWQEKGIQQLGFYEREVQKAKESESSNNVRTGEFATLYRNGF